MARGCARRRHRLPFAALLLLLVAIALGITRGTTVVVPGSWPPTCRGRCGGCAPCRAVHVAIQPGRSFPLEYYPEAWRCTCHHKLFMP